MKDKLKSYEFWVSVVGAIAVILQGLSAKIDVPYLSQSAMALLGALAVWGILKKSKTSPQDGNTQDGDEKENKEGR